MADKIKRYTNSEEKEFYATLSSYINLLHKSLKESGRNKMAKRWLKTSLTFAEKGLREWLSTLDVKEIKTLIKLSEKVQCYVTYNSEAVKHTREMMELAGTYILDGEAMMTLVEAALHGDCRNCKMTKEEAEECDLRKVMYERTIPPADEYSETCPYRYEMPPRTTEKSDLSN